MKCDIENWISRIEAFGKENREEILPRLTGAIQEVIGRGHCRIYLENLTEGVLEVIEQMRLRGVIRMSKLARRRAVCDPKTETKQFYRFKNFRHKTVKI